MKKLRSLGQNLSKIEQKQIKGGNFPEDAEAVYKYICENETTEHPYSPETTIGRCRHDINEDCPTTHGYCYYESTSIFV